MSGPLQERFEHARSLSGAERESYLSGLAATEPDSAARLRLLLAAAEAGESPLDANPWTAFEEDEAATPLPDRIGPYRVVSEIGRGGMGRVYLALQEGEGFSRRLAIKVVAPEGASPDIERRFRDERRILAGLDHPGIARFHDAGRDQGGRWFLALEYVEGANLIDHARAWNLSTEERLRLFLRVLEAVAYAHERSVVHRDLKPANILVATDGRPRLLDFGIAKLLDAGSASAELVTSTSMRALTPAYASPEQFRGDAVTPASDVFSLGVLLYELLAGVRPFGADGGSQAAIEREVLFTDPEPPSTASRRSAAGGPPERSPERGRLSRDLDAICLKALRKEPARRYPTAAELADDLRRHLAGQPVAARGDDRRYRFGRFLGRNRAALAVAGALAVAAVAIGLALGAERGGAARAPVEPAPQPFRFGGISGKDAPDLEAAFTAAPADVDAGARLALALQLAGRTDEAMLIVARLRQIPGHGEDPLVDYVEATIAMSVKESQRALVLFGTALDRAVALGRGDLVAQIRASRGRLLFTLGRRNEALADMESARGSFESVGDQASLARVLNDLAIDPLVNGRLAEGEALLEQALAASRASGAGGSGLIVLNLAMIAVQRGYPDRAEPRLREVIENLRRAKSRRLALAELALTEALRDLGRRAEARTTLGEALALLSGASGEGSLAYALRFRGDEELHSGELAKAEATARELEALAKGSGDRMALGFSNRLRGEIAAERGQPAEARARLGEARRLHVANGEGEEADDVDVVWAQIELRFGDAAAAREVASRVRPDPAAAIEKTSQFLAEAILARVDAHEGRRQEAARRLTALEAQAAGRTSVRWISGLEAARAAVAGAAKG